MASDIEIERVRKDIVGWRVLAANLFRRADQASLRDDAIDFLQGILSRRGLDELSYRQAEWLLDIRDDMEVVSTFRGFSLKILIERCFESRGGLSDEEEESWIAGLHGAGRTSLRKSEARRVYKLARRLGEVDSDWAA